MSTDPHPIASAELQARCEHFYGPAGIRVNAPARRRWRWPGLVRRMRTEGT